MGRSTEISTCAIREYVIGMVGHRRVPMDQQFVNSGSQYKGHSKKGTFNTIRIRYCRRTRLVHHVSVTTQAEPPTAHLAARLVVVDRSRDAIFRGKRGAHGFIRVARQFDKLGREVSVCVRIRWKKREGGGRLCCSRLLHLGQVGWTNSLTKHRQVKTGGC